MKIILTGFMGSGKTEVSKKLSSILNLPLIELDELTLKLSGRKNISEIFAIDGEEKFREFESQTFKNIVEVDAVISAGGGTKVESGKIIYLRTSFPVISDRLNVKTDRPLFNNEARKLYEKRIPKYEKSADIIIDTDLLSIDEVAEEIIRNLNVCMIIGDPVSYSLSPKMHNAAYEALNLDFVYFAKKVTSEDLKNVPDFIRKFGIKGVSVTAPHKIEIMKFLDEIDENARKIGAVNTILNKDGKICGYNTDVDAISDLLKNHRGKKIAILGDGGMAKAMEYAARNFKIFSRKSGNFDSEDLTNFEIIMNATPIGMNPDETPVPKKYLRKGQIVFDAVYSSEETRLIREAKSFGAETVNGKEILLKQGMAQFKLFTGHDAPEKIMRKSIT